MVRKVGGRKLDIKKILVWALLIRLLFLPFVYHGDVEVTYWWGKFAVDFNLTGYYDWLNFGGYGRPDQPMFNILYCKAIRQVYEFLYQILWFINVNIKIFPSTLMTWYQDHGNQILLKFPMILADLGLIYLVFWFFYSKKEKGRALLAAKLLAIYPPLIYNSAIWGSGDGIVSLLGLLALFLLVKKRYFVFPLVLLSSVYYKPSLIILIPLFGLVFIKNKPSLKEIAASVLSSLLFVHLISRPFSPREYFPIIWNINIMVKEILPGCMHQLTSNAMNFWALIFGLKPRLDELQIFSFLTARQFSLILTVTLHLILYINLFKKYSLKRLLLTWVNISLLSFVFLTRMHERYTFPALIPLAILVIQDRKYLKFFVALSVTHMLNVYNWWWWPQFQPLVDFLKNDIIIRLISAVNIYLAIGLFWQQIKLPKTGKGSLSTKETSW